MIILTQDETKQVLDRFDRRCAICGAEHQAMKSGTDRLIYVCLEIYPKDHNKRNRKPENLIPLCASCGDKHDKAGREEARAKTKKMQGELFT